MKIKIYSKAAHSTWIFFPEFDLLMDCGEGCATQLGINTVAGIKDVIILHDHWDHLTGLINLIFLRKRHGENIKKINIFLPETNKTKNLIEFIGRQDYVNWIFVGKNNSLIELSKTRAAQLFLTNHCLNSLGVNLIEKRTRLKEEYKGLNPTEIRRLIEQQVVIKENWTKTLVTYTGDTPPIKDVSVFNNPEILITDCTYLDPADNNENYKHCTFTDAWEMFSMSGAKKMIGIHVSARYNKEYIENKFKEGNGLVDSINLQDPDTIGEYNL